MSSRTNSLYLLTGLLLSACAYSAPSLPSDTTSVNRLHAVALSDFAPADQAMSCNEIGSERAKIVDDMHKASDAIEANHTNNQAAQYVSLITPLALLAAERNEAEREAIQNLYARQDVLSKLATLKSCEVQATASP